MKDETCVFCKFATDKGVVAWENEMFFAMYDTFPVSSGHALVIPKNHIVTIGELSDAEWTNLGDAVKQTIKMIEGTDLKKLYQTMLESAPSDISRWFIQKAISQSRTTTKPNSYNHGVNDGKEAGRTVNHLHWHIIPRYSGDMEDPRGGVRYVIPNMGNYKIPRQ